MKNVKWYTSALLMIDWVAWICGQTISALAHRTQLNLTGAMPSRFLLCFFSFLLGQVLVVVGVALWRRHLEKGHQFCSSCRHFNDDTCRRYPPTSHLGITTWPVISPDEYACGEHRPYQPED